MTEAAFWPARVPMITAKPQAAPAPTAICARTLASLCWAALAFGFSGSFAIHAAALTMPLGDQTSIALGLSTAWQAAGIIVGAPLAVWLLHHIGSRQLALAACIAAATALAVLPMTPGSLAKAVERLVLGIGLGLGVTVRKYTLTPRPTQNRRSLVIALYATCFSGGAALGPAVIFCLGTGAASYLLGVSALGLAATALCLGDLRARAERPEAPVAVLHVVRRAPFAAAALIYGLSSSGLLDFMGAFALQCGYPAEDASLVALSGLLAVLILQIPIGSLGDYVTPSKLLPVCALLTLAILVAVINVAGDLRALCACVFLLGGLCDAFYTVGLAALANRVPKAQLAAATGCFVGFCGADEIAGPLAAGVGLDMAGAGALILPFAVLMSAYGGVM